MANDTLFGKPKSLRGLKPASVNVRPKRKDSKPSRVDLKPEEFENLIEDQGIYVRITPSILCPNRTDLGDTNHVLDCPLCFGDQLIDSPENAVETWAFLQGIKGQKELQVQGIYDIKDATITTKQAVKLYYWYKIEVLDFSAVYNQLLKRGTGDTDRIRYSSAKPGSAPLTVLTDEVLQASAPDVPTICIDSSGIRYARDKDFKIADRQLQWLSKLRRPKSGTLYSLIYPVLPTFRVLDLVHEHRYYYVSFKRLDKVPVHLPQQAVIRWDYLARGSGNQVLAPVPSVALPSP